MTRVVSVIVESCSTTPPAKFESVATWTKYEAAPIEFIHRSVSVVGMFMAPLAGETSSGTSGGVKTVVKFHVEEKADVPPMFFALTRQ
jgi:hypothetical protein